jgi:hypothetical protein
MSSVISRDAEADRSISLDAHIHWFNVSIGPYKTYVRRDLGRIASDAERLQWQRLSERLKISVVPSRR